MFFRLFLVLKAALFSLSFLYFVAWPAQVFAENSKILVLGDSLSAAYGIAKPQGWASLLQTKLQAEHYRYDVMNASISGETSSGGVSRIDALLKQNKPKVVILALGANDGLRGLPIKEMTANLDNIITKSKQSGAKLLLVGMKIPPNYGPKYTKDFEQSYQLLSKRHHVPLVPFMLDNVAVKTDLIQDDGLHPNALGQPIILDNIWPALILMLKK